MQIRAAADSKYGHAFHNWQDLKGKPPALDGRFSMLETKRGAWGIRYKAQPLNQQCGFSPSAESIWAIFILSVLKSGYSCLAQSGQMP